MHTILSSSWRARIESMSTPMPSPSAMSSSLISPVIIFFKSGSSLCTCLFLLTAGARTGVCNLLSLTDTGPSSNSSSPSLCLSSSDCLSQIFPVHPWVHCLGVVDALDWAHLDVDLQPALLSHFLLRPSSPNDIVYRVSQKKHPQTRKEFSVKSSYENRC